MENIVSVVRTEKKYNITLSQKNALINLLKEVMKADAYSDLDGYNVRSLYFDSIYDDDYFNKIDGLEFRKKIRLRIYSPDQETVKLEWKQKQGTAQQKRSLTISRVLAENMIQGNYEGLLELNSQLATDFYLELVTGVYKPKCIVEYRRIAFAEEENDTRITFDSDICTSFICEKFFEEDLNLIPVRMEPELEVKYNGFLLSFIKQIVSLADSPEVAISKYALSRQILGM